MITEEMRERVKNNLKASMPNANKDRCIVYERANDRLVKVIKNIQSAHMGKMSPELVAALERKRRKLEKDVEAHIKGCPDCQRIMEINPGYFMLENPLRRKE